MSTIPLDILINIFSLIPAVRDSHEADIKTLVNAMKASRLLNEAACVSSVWEAHYRARYTHANKLDEETRMEMYANWRLMYLERRRLDGIALNLLDEIVMHRIGRYTKAQVLSQMALDVWDVLELESHLPVPIPFQQDTNLIFNAEVAPHALTRRYWAKSMCEVILKAYAYEIFQEARDDRVSFDETMSALSCFFGVPPAHISRQLDQLAIECRTDLDKHGTVLDPEDANYSLPDIAKGIYQFMRDRDFGPVDDSDAQYRRMLNLFPHAYLTTHRKTIPISLIHVFVALARRLGVDASPVNFPGTVLAHISLPAPGNTSIYINAFAPDVAGCIVNFEAGSPHLYSNMSEYLAPVGSSLMLLRSARNILSAATTVVRELRVGFQVPLCVHLLFQADNRSILEILANMTLNPLDCATFLLDKVAPTLQVGRLQHLLRQCCRTVLQAENHAAQVMKRRVDNQSVKYFVGMPFEHVRYGYIGCIIGWDENCTATYEWIQQMKVDTLPRGREQPFYNVLSVDGSQRYVAEENISPIELEELVISHFNEANEMLPMYFEGAEINRQNGSAGRCRLLLSPESAQAYPDDDLVGSTWVTSNVLPA
ncbi:hypothetical protein BDQ12DRAFT_736713 [Crucibulum laeve]|uniref:Hemimethylated DNA-binding domain-containing protein n=1 Tax=Crucibulum laeve TaxID=68775 RepID=A0A5C3LXX5_9AGAR|nr:hypothetical protein BDQ12DRAFT_736713 [Crucibulum laeve]